MASKAKGVLRAELAGSYADHVPNHPNLPKSNRRGSKFPIIRYLGLR